MRRRTLIFLPGGCIAAAVPLSAQQKPVPLIGYLNGTSPAANAAFLAAFREGLADAGHIEGQNLTIEYRWARFHYDRLPALAGDLVARKVALIAAFGGAGEALAAKQATSTIPIVFTTGADPIAIGLVRSLSRPGGNITGVATPIIELLQKRVELASELVPRARVIGLLVNPNNPSAARIIRSVQQAGSAKRLQVRVLEADTAGEIDAAFAALARQHIGAMLVADPLFDSLRQEIVALAARHGVPAVYISRQYVDAGGLVSYGPVFETAYRQAGVYAGKILDGTSPGDLPVQQPTKYELVVNLKTAKALGLKVPPLILARADEVIQ